uniref:Uncharacterized protein n=1 Tax=Knipowitschia caucasica TaxID=637954 RepID=A0AAV2M5V9_KNICA
MQSEEREEKRGERGGGEGAEQQGGSAVPCKQRHHLFVLRHCIVTHLRLQGRPQCHPGAEEPCAVVIIIMKNRFHSKDNRMHQSNDHHHLWRDQEDTEDRRRHRRARKLLAFLTSLSRTWGWLKPRDRPSLQRSVSALKLLEV